MFTPHKFLLPWSRRNLTLITTLRSCCFGSEGALPLFIPDRSLLLCSRRSFAILHFTRCYFLFLKISLCCSGPKGTLTFCYFSQVSVAMILLGKIYPSMPLTKESIAVYICHACKEQQRMVGGWRRAVLTPSSLFFVPFTPQIFFSTNVIKLFKKWW